jgi:glucose 1-dehydrogenase
MDLSGAIALVTGGGHRVGKGIVLALSAAGADVFIHYGRSADEAETTAAEAEQLGARVEIGSADLSDLTVAPALVAEAASALGPVSILVNSASGFPEDTLTNVTVEGWERTLQLTVGSPAFLAQAVARGLPESGEGAIVNISDWRTARPYPDHFSYSIAKGALEAFTRTAAVALAPRIRVNAVALGAILPPPGKGSEYLKELATGLPLERTGSVEVVADAALSLLRNDFITGEIVRVDGGAHLT